MTPKMYHMGQQMKPFWKGEKKIPTAKKKTLDGYTILSGLIFLFEIIIF